MSMLRHAELNRIVYTSVCLFQLPAQSVQNTEYGRVVNCNALHICAWVMFSGASHHHYQEHTHSLTPGPSHI